MKIQIIKLRQGIFWNQLKDAVPQCFERKIQRRLCGVHRRQLEDATLQCFEEGARGKQGVSSYGPSKT